MLNTAAWLGASKESTVGGPPTNPGQCKEGLDVTPVEILELCCKLGNAAVLKDVLAVGKRMNNMYQNVTTLMNAMEWCCFSPGLTNGAKMDIVQMIMSSVAEVVPGNQPPHAAIRSGLSACLLGSLNLARRSHRQKDTSLELLCIALLDYLVVKPGEESWNAAGCWTDGGAASLAAKLGPEIILLGCRHALLRVVDTALHHFLTRIDGLSANMFMQELERQVAETHVTMTPTGRRRGSAMTDLVSQDILGILVGWLPVPMLLRMHDGCQDAAGWGLLHYAIAEGRVDAAQCLLLLLHSATKDDGLSFSPSWGATAGSPHPLLVAIRASQMASVDVIINFLRNDDEGTVLHPEPAPGALMMAAIQCTDHRLTKRIMEAELAELDEDRIKCSAQKAFASKQALALAAKRLLRNACRTGRQKTAVVCLDLFPRIFEIASNDNDGKEQEKVEQGKKGKGTHDLAQRSDLHWCAMHDMHEVIPALVQNQFAGRPDDAVDAAGCTALLYARAMGSVRATRALVECSASSMLRSAEVVSLWQHISYTNQHPKTNLRDGLYVGVQFSLEPDEDDSIHGTVDKLFPAAITDGGESLFQVRIPNYAD